MEYKNNTIYRVSVGILSWNRKDALEIALESVKKQTIFSQCEVIVLDNGSQDGSQTLIREHYPWVILSERTENSGLAEGRNILVRMANAPLVFWMDDDCELIEENCLEELVVAMERNPTHAVVYGKILEGGFDGYPHTSPPPDVSRETVGNLRFFPATFASGGTCVDKDFFLKLGGYEKDYFRMNVENTFSYKVFGAGKRILYLPLVTIVHRPHKYGRNFRTINFYSFRNKMLGNWRYLPFSIAFFLSIFDFFIYFANSFTSKEKLMGFLKGLFDFLKKLPKCLLDERKPISWTAFNNWSYCRHYIVDDSIDIDRYPTYSVLKFISMEIKTRVLRHLFWKRDSIFLKDYK